MPRKARITVAIVIGVLAVLVGTAFALSNMRLILGTIPSYNFGKFGPGHPVPATVQFQSFTLQPGEGVPWHYHKVDSYVILAHGNLTMQHVMDSDDCGSQALSSGRAFVEPAGNVHRVVNTGNDVALIWWATVFPKSDGIVQYTPEFKSGGIYPVSPPNCED